MHPTKKKDTRKIKPIFLNIKIPIVFQFWLIFFVDAMSFNAF
ncbi:unannotated protein [freshwater metagenome]|uniref:Unannotated protein n=1 Tax=freshwater metagenome TaxID=449393 RepID=A0A6J7W843_9ZZZZ